MRASANVGYASEVAFDAEEEIAPPTPLRRPRSPISNKGPGQRDRGQPNNFNKDKKRRFTPPDHHPQAAPQLRTPHGYHANQDGRRQQNNDEDSGEKQAQQSLTSPKAQSSPKNEPVKKELAPKQQPSKSNAVETKTDKCTTVELASSNHQATGISPFPNNKLANTNASTKPAKPASLGLIPAQYLIQKLAIGDEFLLSVDHKAEDCATKQPGFVCLVLHAAYQDQYNLLLEDIFENETPYTANPGDTFAYLDPSDGGWYRARCLARTRAALLDSGKLVSLSANDSCRTLAKKYEQIPEFCCVLTGKVQLGMSLKCTVLMKNGDNFDVSVDVAGEDTYIGQGTVTRWLPEVEKIDQTSIEKPKTTTIPTQNKSQPTKENEVPTVTAIQDKAPVKSSPQIPSVPRPPIVNNRHYYLMHVASLKRACVRPCSSESTAEFEGILQDVLLYGLQKSKQLSSPPQPGDLVLSLFEDIHYRALVKRTKAKDNRYMIEYVEYGNEEIVPLEKLYDCPPELDLKSRPVQASIIQLSLISSTDLPPPALQYIDGVKELEELIAKIPDQSKEAPSGSLVELVLEKNSESVNKKLEQMCTPEWKKLEEGGGDVLDSEVVLFSQMKSHPLPTDRKFIMDVTDFGNIESGLVCGFEQGDKLADYIYGPLTDKINSYCQSVLCNEPYLPMVEEMCLAKLPPYEQWFRAVVVEHRPGDSMAAVLFVDYGNLEANVPVANLRKCMPEFCDQPALAATADIKFWPKQATNEQILRAVEFLQINEEGRGTLHVKSCERVPDDLSYIIEVPDLIAAINKA